MRAPKPKHPFVLAAVHLHVTHLIHFPLLRSCLPLRTCTLCSELHASSCSSVSTDSTRLWRIAGRRVSNFDARRLSRCKLASAMR